MRLALLSVSLSALAAVFCTIAGHAESPQQAQTLQTTEASDREKLGLRGSVRTCTEDSISPAATLADGTQVPESQSSVTWEYSHDGRLMATYNLDGDGTVSTTRYTYDGSGRLLNSISGKAGRKPVENVFSYDDDGTLRSVSNLNLPENKVTYGQDERGRKTKTIVGGPSDYHPNRAAAANAIFTADIPPNLPGGGTGTMIYDEHDRPIEYQLRDSSGGLVSRSLRIYDARGNLISERQVFEGPERMLPPESLAALEKESGASADEVRQEFRVRFTQLMGGQEGPYSTAYTYDSQGRVRTKRERVFNREQETTITYNEHGDEVSEITSSRQVGPDVEGGLPPQPPYSETRYSYVYDSFGNWTEQVITQYSQANGPAERTSRRLRSLTYY